MSLHHGIQVRSEGARGCGHRKLGGLYLVCDGLPRACGKLPLPLSVCPCCGMGIRPSRAPKWIENPRVLWDSVECDSGQCGTCPLATPNFDGGALLMWVGEKYYPTPSHFSREAAYMGISRRIQHIPKGFVLGKTWVLLAHRKAVELGGLGEKCQHLPGLFRAFCPTRIEVIVSGHENPDYIDSLIERGLTPVMIAPRETPRIELPVTAEMEL